MEILDKKVQFVSNFIKDKVPEVIEKMKTTELYKLLLGKADNEVFIRKTNELKISIEKALIKSYEAKDDINFIKVI